MKTINLEKQADKLIKADERAFIKAIYTIDANQAALWQRSYEIWGKTSLRFRYPLLHGPLTKEEKQERKQRRIQFQKKQQDDKHRFAAYIENEWYKNWYEKFHSGTLNPIPYSLIACCLAPDIDYHTMQAVKYLEEKLAAEMLASDIPFTMNIPPLTSPIKQSNNNENNS